MKFNGTVLLVDDEAHIRKFVGLILRQIGLTKFTEAANGAEAVLIYERDRPDLVLLDVNMPIMDGLETLKKLRTIDPDGVVIMLTSLSNRQTVESALELGATDYIRKDTPKAEIARALAETIDACFESDAEPESKTD